MKELKHECDDGLPRWIDRFLTSQPYLSRVTCTTYRWILAKFCHSVRRASLHRSSDPIVITQHAVVNWLRSTSRRVTFRTLGQRVVPARRFLAFLKEKKNLREDPFGVMLAQYPGRGLRGIIRALIGDCPKEAMEALIPLPHFRSPMGDALQRFLTFERSLGKRYEGEECTLRRFDAFLNSYPQPPTRLSADIVNDWLRGQHRNKASTQYERYLLIRKFCIHLRREDPTAYVPPARNSPRGVDFVPYIYSRTEIARLLEAARRLRASRHCPLLPEMFHALLALLYTSGLRLGEALKLRLCDVDWEEPRITIRETKFFKCRVIPLSRSMRDELGRYVELSQQAGGLNRPDSPLFQNPRTLRAFTHTWAEHTFSVVRDRVGLRRSGKSPPRLHDLRHSFAVHRLEDWYQAGDDVQSKLGLLSTYMGHASLAGTQRYLTMTPELLQHASERFERFFHSQRKDASQ